MTCFCHNATACATERLFNQATTRLTEGNLESARNLLLGARELVSIANELDKHNGWLPLFNEAKLSLAQGLAQDTTQGKTYIAQSTDTFEQALVMPEKLNGAEHEWSGVSCVGLAEAYIALGRHNEAQDLVNRAHAILSRDRTVWGWGTVIENSINHARQQEQLAEVSRVRSALQVQV